jgi:twinkle protein
MSEAEVNHFVYHSSCEDCGSSDALANYADGGTHCFSCGKTRKEEQPTIKPKKESAMTKEFLTGEFKSLPSRRITEDTCRKYGYFCTDGDKPSQVANYRKDGEVVAQKVRKAGKVFSTIGNPNHAGFYGQHLFREGGKMLVITEGEIDALSVFQAMGSKWPSVSLPSGAQGAAKVIQQELTWLESFDKIVLAFDMDEPGRNSIQTVAPLLEPGKVFVAELPAKDPNECIVQGKSSDLVRALWDAHPYRPDGVVDAAELWDEVNKVENFETIPYPWEGLNGMTHGIRKGELLTITSGSGMGKSQMTREIMYHLLIQGKKVGGLFLEESVKRTTLGLMGTHCNLPLHIHGFEVDPDSKREAFDATAGTGRLMLYDHFGSSDVDNIIDKIKFMASNGCDYIVLDHVSMVVSGLETSDERKLIDVLMTKLRTVVSRFDIGMIIVSHLKRPDGIAHENGGMVSLAQLRGSAAIAQLSDMCLGLERDQQADDPAERHLTKVRVLKNRYTGETGIGCQLTYNPKTGRLAEFIPGNTPTQTTTALDDPFNDDF